MSAFKLNQADIKFVLFQIKVAEAHSAGIPLTEIRLDPVTGEVIADRSRYDADGKYIIPVGDTDLQRAIPDPHVPVGLRTVDGSYNNLIPGREHWGAADQVMPRLLDPSFRNDADGDTFSPGGPPINNTNYNGTANVADADPRIISNLIVDMSLKNPAAIQAWLNNPIAQSAWEDANPGAVMLFPGDAMVPGGVYVTNADIAAIPNIATDEGLTASFNAWMTFFGQFFDHGLDLISKGGNVGKVYIPLQADDPLMTHGVDGIAGNADDLVNHPELAFMVLTRSTLAPDGSHEAVNTTTPFVDQNQTYTSHASHQAFLREYVIVDGKAVSTGNLLNGANDGLPTWADIKAQARDLLGIQLDDRDVGNIPLLRTDAYGELILSPTTGFAQIIIGLGADGIPNTADDIVASGTPDSPINPTAIGAFRIGHAFLDDIADNAIPVVTGGVLMADADADTGNLQPRNAQGQKLSYDDELLDRHFITGDGRGNENIGLTTVHHIFHSEHNRQVADQKLTILQSGDLAFINEWLATDLADLSGLPGPNATPLQLQAYAATLNWDGERLFQAGRYATEMQYQHLVFEEFARKIQPNIDLFVFNNITDINPAIFAEFAHTVYRFGHSMLTDNMPRIDEAGDTFDATLDLVKAFTNPVSFDHVNDGIAGNDLTADEAAASIIRGMTIETGNEIDEFIVSSLRNNLLGLPLDLAALNIARGREAGVPTLNEARTQLFSATNSSFLKPYDNWVDFAGNLKNSASVINFIAAYGTHPSIPEDGTLEQKRDAATLLVMGGVGQPLDRVAYLTGTGDWAGVETGLNLIDLWIGGLAEKVMPFGGMLGSTFNAVFEAQLENLQDGDRLYYLTRNQGQNLLVSLEQNSFAKLIMANTNLAKPGADGIRGTGDDVIDRHIGVDAFAKYDFVMEVNAANQADYDPNNLSASGVDPSGGDPILEAIGLGKVLRDNPLTAVDESIADSSADQSGVTGHYLRFTGGEHIVAGGTIGNDIIITDEGDDGIWGDAGDDYIESGAGVDLVNGGAGNDIMLDSGDTGDFLKGDEGDDVIANSNGFDIVMGGSGQDVVFAGVDDTEVFAGQGNDFVLGGEGVDVLMGNEGDDWLEGQGGFDTIAGDNSELFFNSTVIGHDVMFAGNEEQDFDAESGDDIMVQGESVIRNEGMFGFDWSIYKGVNIAANADLGIPIFTTEQADILRNRFDKVEALSGWDLNDTLVGDNRVAGVIVPGDITATTEGVFFNDGLDQAGINRIDGLSQIVAVGPNGFFESGNILIGGAGSDVLKGNAGNDIIDGDRWLNVRIRITGAGEVNSAANQLATVDSLRHIFTAAEVAGNPETSGWAGKSLFDLMVSRTIVPNQLHIVREILTTGATAADTDIAVFSDNRVNYTITTVGDVTTVTHTGFGTATSIVVDDDGTDTLRNIEKLRFADGEIFLNRPATGAPVISDLTPTEGQQLTVATASIADSDGLGAFAYQWQLSNNGGTTWTDIAPALGGTNPNFTPNEGLLGLGSQVGGILRVRVSFTDGGGNAETLFSAPTGVVGDDWNAIPFLQNNFVGTAGDDIADGTSGLAGFGAADTFTGNGGNDVLNGAGGTDTAIYSGPVTNFNFAQAGANLIVTDLTGADGVDTLNSIETLRFAGINHTLVNGDASGQTLNGGTGANANRTDILLGHGGVDTLNGNGGNDVLVGGAGNDTVNGNAGNDTILWRVGDGRDLVNGDTAAANIAGTSDTFHVAGDASAETFAIYAVTPANAAVRTALQTSLGTTFNANTEIVITRTVGAVTTVVAELDNIEEIGINTLNVTANDGGGLNTAGSGDTITVVGDFTSTSLNFSTITVNGTTGNDTVDITALLSAHRIVFHSNGGSDTIVGTLRAQDVIELAPGASLADYHATVNGNGTTTFSNGTHSITYASAGTPAFQEVDPTPGNDEGVSGAFEYTASDLSGLKALVNGLQPDFGDDDVVPTGVRNLSGHGNNIANPNWGAADEPFIRITTPHYGAPDANGNLAINPLFAGLDPRVISDLIGTQEAGLPDAGNDANIFFMAMGQYIDHGLDFIGKGGNGTIQIGAAGGGAPGSNNPADLTRATVDGYDANGIPQHINHTSPFVDQNQAYGSNTLVGQFLREGNGSGGLGAHLLAGAPDPSSPAFNLLPTLRELIQHHWANNTLFTDDQGNQVRFQDYFAGLVDANGTIDSAQLPGMISSFMGSGHALLLDTNPYINVLDHYVAGDGRANENFALTSIHTIWARNHNHHVEALEAAGFQGTAEELFQAAKIINEAEYQRVVFKEYADTLLGGLRGQNATHGFQGYDPTVNPGISHEFASAVFRFGHSLIGQTMTILDADGNPTEVSLFDAFLNPTNDEDAFTLPLATLAQYNYVPQPGYEQHGVSNVIGGIVSQPAEDVDVNLVDAIRNDLVRISADLFTFNQARGWDVGIGTLNQVRRDLMNSTDPHVQESVGYAGDLSPYTSWQDFQARNGLSNAVIAQFMQAFPDLVLASADIAAFHAINPDIEVAMQPNGTGIVKGIDRVDLWLGGLAEAHINGGIVGQTYWVVLHDQFDRLQDGDRFYYVDRLDEFDFYQNFIDGQEFADIIARNTGMTDLPEHMFRTDELDDEDQNGEGPADDDDQDDDDDDGTPVGDDDDDEDDDDGTPVGNDDDDEDDDDDDDDDGTPVGSDDDDDDEDDDDDDDEDVGGSDEDDEGCGQDDDDDDGAHVPPPASGPGQIVPGTAAADILLGTSGDDTIIGLGGDDSAIGGSGADVLRGDGGNDFLSGEAGRDVIFGGDGNDDILGGTGKDMLYGDGGNDRIFGNEDDDLIDAGSGNDTVYGGAGDDIIVAAVGDGDDVYFGDEMAGGIAGNDTLDMSAILSSITADLGTGFLGRGSVSSSQSGSDTLWNIENIVTGSGNDTITASSVVNAMDGGAGNDTFRFLSAADANGDTILGFQPGDKIDVSAIDAKTGTGANDNFTLVPSSGFNAAGALNVSYETRDGQDYTIVSGNLDGGNDAEFKIDIRGHHVLNSGDFSL